MAISRVAIFVDGDNVGVRHSDYIQKLGRELGCLSVARVYANGLSSEWVNDPGMRLMYSGNGKNSTDLLLSIDAIEMAVRGGLDKFVIATSDADFAHLTRRLCELGHHVLGIGEEKAPEVFRRACSEFRCLPASKPCARKPEPATKPNCSEFDQNIRSMIALHSQNGQGMKIAELAPQMHKKHGTRISTQPEGNWRSYLLARPTLYDVDPRGPEARVRFRPEGFA